MRTTNLFILIGRLGQEPRQVGRAVKLNVATDRFWRDADGQRKQATDWVTATCFGRIGEYVLANARAGQGVSIHAHVAEGSYVKDGITHYSTDVIVDRLDIIASHGGPSEDE